MTLLGWAQGLAPGFYENQADRDDMNPPIPQTPISSAERAAMKGQQPFVIWLTGLSGAGKSTIAAALDRRLFASRRHGYVLDGDILRHGLNKDLGFSATDRTENIRRIGEVSRLFLDAGLVVISAFISPFRADRDMLRGLFREGEFFEIHVDAPLAVCESRDPKGLYRRARAGTLKDFTGISSPYEPPLRPELVLPTATLTVEACVDLIINMLVARGMLQPGS